jgi:hypothetical protein
MTRLNQKSNDVDEDSLTLKLKEIEKEVFITNSETENYKRTIDTLKNKLEFKINLERAISLENILKLETNKNKDIKKELDSLTKVNVNQIKAISNYDKENRFSEKIDILKNEIKTAKDSLKDYQEKNSKQEKYIKSAHEKMSSLENNIKKLLVPKVEVKKSFTKDDLKQILEVLNRYKIEVKENRKKLSNFTKHNDEKMNTYVTMNKKIEMDFKENDKVYKYFNPSFLR